MNETRWIFGYGSILWKTGFKYEEKQLACLKGYGRRFWQASTDHRGTIEAPGRVVTLTTDPQEVCWGLAYRVAEQNWTDVLALLDHREKGGYEQQNVSIHGINGEPLDAITYIADDQNDHYLGHAELSLISSQIINAHGPSGPNKEYILNLDAALTEHNIADDHVSQLADLVRSSLTPMDNHS